MEHYSEILTTRRTYLSLSEPPITIEYETLVRYRKRRHPGKGIVGHHRRFNNRARRRGHDQLAMARHVLVPIDARVLSEKQIPNAEQVTF